MTWRPAAGVVVVLLVVLAAGTRLIAPAPHPVDEWQDAVSGIEFRLIPAGTFSMGTPPAEQGREPEEVLHEVTLSRSFYMGVTEVTQAQWTRVMGANPSHFQSCGPRCPVENVSWSDVRRFIQHLNVARRRGFRLPTEAEWEYACRAGGSKAFGLTDSLTSQTANINGNYPYNGPRGTFREQPIPVGRFAANAWHLFDMSGNVWEWTEDEHCPYPSISVTDPVGACGSQLRVIRGGSWLFDGNSARCGTRYTHRPQDRGPSLGVRLAHDASLP